MCGGAPRCQEVKKPDRTRSIFSARYAENNLAVALFGEKSFYFNRFNSCDENTSELLKPLFRQEFRPPVALNAGRPIRRVCKFGQAKRPKCSNRARFTRR